VAKRIVWTLVAVFAAVPGLCVAQKVSERLEGLAAQAQERALDLFPVAEIFGRGAGPRQDRLELNLTDEHRERQRAHHRWVLAELDHIPAAEFAPTEQLSYALLGSAAPGRAPGPARLPRRGSGGRASVDQHATPAHRGVDRNAGQASL
jgi:hypothetical protein